MTKNSIDRAKGFFYKNDYKSALEIFTQEEDFFSAGLCSLMLKDEKKARFFWKKNHKTSPASAFGLCILKLIHLDTSKLPTFFQTRAHLEIFLNLFLKNDCLEWAENVISSCDDLFYSNPEAYKFIGRALFSNGYFNLAIKFCKRSLKIFYSDPESLLIISQCYFLLGDLGEALDYVNKIFAILDDYYPAIIFRKIVKDEILKKH